MERIKLSIPASVWAEVKRRATEQGVSGAHYIRQAVVERIARENGSRQ